VGPFDGRGNAGDDKGIPRPRNPLHIPHYESAETRTAFLPWLERRPPRCSGP
jgi:hypothetical protein